MARDAETDHATPAGWYPDPVLRSRERYFDGHAWTSSVRTGNDVTSDPLGPLPPGRTSWLSPRVTELLARPAQPTAWERHRKRIVLATVTTVVVAVVATALVRPAAAAGLALVVIALTTLGVRSWAASRGEDELASGKPWFPRD